MDRGCLEAHPGKQPFHEALPFGQLFEGFEGRFVHEAEVSHIRRYPHFDSQLCSDRTASPCFFSGMYPRPVIALGEHDVGPLLPRRDEGRDQLWRILQVGVDWNDRIPFGRFEASGERGLLAEVPRKLDDGEARVPIDEELIACKVSSRLPSSTQMTSKRISGTPSSTPRSSR